MFLCTYVIYLFLCTYVVYMYLCHIFDRTGFRIENAYTHNGQITNPTERKLVRRKMKIENGELKIESTMTMAVDDGIG